MTVTSALWATLHDQHSVAALIRALRSDGDDIMAKLQLQWISLSACRFSEAQLITHDEIDLARKVRPIPAQRTKANRDHAVPITDAMVELLFAAAKQRPTSADYVFVNKRCVLQAAQSAALQGVRAAFADWAKSDGKFSSEVIHAQLGHRPSAVDAAHSRKSMMEAWAAYLVGASDFADTKAVLSVQRDACMGAR